MECKNCGNTDNRNFYMLSKGTQTGLYCRRCNKWIKWLGKKEISALSSQGVHTLKQPPEIKAVHSANEGLWCEATKTTSRGSTSKATSEDLGCIPNKSMDNNNDCPFDSDNSTTVTQTVCNNVPKEQLECLSCGSTEFIKKQTSIHIGLYCAKCGKWRKWVKKG